MDGPPEPESSALPTVRRAGPQPPLEPDRLRRVAHFWRAEVDQFWPAAKNPKAHRRVEGRIRQAIVRRFPYVVLFGEYPDYVEILAVFHTSRDPKQWQGREGS